MKSIFSREHVFLCDYSDIDECALGSAICPDGQGCYNQEGSYRCRTCPPGSEVDPVTKVCRTLPQCTTGFAYNSATGSCQGNAAMKMNAKHACKSTSTEGVKTGHFPLICHDYSGYDYVVTLYHDIL